MLGRNIKSYPQQMEYQDNEPSDYPTDRADDHGKRVDGYVVGKDEIGEEQEDQPDDPVDDEPTQKTAASRKQEQDHYYDQYEYDDLHRAPLYMRRRYVTPGS